MLCPSPIILDHSFPHDSDVLRDAGIALGQLADLSTNGHCRLVLTDVLASFVDLFDWQQVASYPLLQVIHSLIIQWLLQPTDQVIVISVDSEVEYRPHPVPQSCSQEGLIDYWSEEVGKLLSLHDQALGKENGFFLGVACHRAFSGGQLETYSGHPCGRCFPLVGPLNLGILIDSEEWHVPDDIKRKNVTVADARKNIYVLGGDVSKSAEGSHFKVVFRNASRPWPLDPNVDPVPERFLKELRDLLDLPVAVIKFALIEGELPERKSRL